MKNLKGFNELTDNELLEVNGGGVTWGTNDYRKMIVNYLSYYGDAKASDYVKKSSIPVKRTILPGGKVSYTRVIPSSRYGTITVVSPN